MTLNGQVTGGVENWTMLSGLQLNFSWKLATTSGAVGIHLTDDIGKK